MSATASKSGPVATSLKPGVSPGLIAWLRAQTIPPIPGTANHKPVLHKPQPVAQPRPVLHKPQPRKVW